MEADVLRGLEKFKTDYNGPLSVFANEYLKNKISVLETICNRHPNGIALLNYLSNNGASATEQEICGIKANVGSIPKEDLVFLEQEKIIYDLDGKKWLTLTGDIIADFLRMFGPTYENKINKDARNWGTP